MKIVVLDGSTINPGDNPWDPVANLGEVTCYDRTPSELIIEHSLDADILLTSRIPLSATTIERLPRLKFINVLSTAYNIVDLKAARARGIPVANVPIYGTDAVAEFVFALLLNFHRQPQRHSELVQAGEWARVGAWSFWRTPQAELADRTIGIVGFGRIGRRVGELAAAFRMKVLTHDTFQGSPPSYPFEWRNVRELFTESDVVSLHCNLTPENTGMVDRTLLRCMKPTAYLINTSRGPLVNEVDLAEALTQHRLAGAALDVVSQEPIAPNNPLLAAPNVTITPHIAWAAVEARRRMIRITAENIVAFLAGRPIHVVN